MNDTAPPVSAPPPHPVRDALAHLQDTIAAAFGVAPEGREATVVAMLENASKASAGYWLQLLLAMGIASLGLALSSTAVVIGAMLVSPLMGPIVTFGMGLAVASPLLVLRSLARTAASVTVVVSSAALLMLALPFTEVTAEIAARTSPTALDLLIAVFCALAAAHTTMRPPSESTATAAGTAIGISLVPPLCVVGFGLGTGSRAIASGAALLFTANFCAILLFATLTFLLFGYARVSVSPLEQAELGRHHRGAIARLAAGLRYLFGLRYGALFRVLMPLLLLAAIFFPLRAALARVTWQVRVRTAIQGMLARLPQAAVRTSVSVESGSVAVRLVTLGRVEDAARLQAELREQIALVAGVTPKVEVVAVADAATLEQVAASARSSAPVEVVRRVPDLDLLRGSVGGALAGAWPSEAGAVLAHRVEFPAGGGAVLAVVHLGAELGPAGAALLGEELSRRIGAPLRVRDVALPAEPLSAEPDAGAAWLPHALALAARADRAAGVQVCLELPSAPKGKAAKEHELVAGALRALAAAGQAELRAGARWSAALTTGACRDEPADAGAPDGSR